MQLIVLHRTLFTMNMAGKWEHLTLSWSGAREFGKINRASMMAGGLAFDSITDLFCVVILKNAKNVYTYIVRY